MTTLTRRAFVGTAAAACVAKPAIVRAAEPLNVSVVLGNSIHWVQFVAADKGFYKEAGFEPKVLALQSSPQSIQMALSGGFHVATSQPESFVAAVQQGATVLAAMSAPTNKTDWVLTGARGVKSLADLKGKIIGVSSLRTSEVWLTSKLMEKSGIPRDSYNFKMAGTSPAKVAALESAAGDIGAAVLFQPSAEVAIRQGLVPLARYEDMRDYPTILYVVNKDWAAKGDAGKRVSHVIQRSHAWLWDPANRTEALNILAKYTKRDMAILQTIYDDYFVRGKFYSKTGEVDREGLKAALADMAEDGAVFKVAPPPEKFLLDKNLGGLWS
ncbi:MAG TPA: ABC transporter substrate-binding protein [Xanthobacteraceae bacterium]|jgi:ABC-type nitrate/sulfonate/bicarbonate transport system substrate-binding protein|nr:ABC transporter substrate-binding protein [Xanthobacteraceae bacterium]